MLEVVRRGRSQTVGTPEYLRGHDSATGRPGLTSDFTQSPAQGNYAAHVGQTPQEELFSGLAAACEDACRPGEAVRDRRLSRCRSARSDWRVEIGSYEEAMAIRNLRLGSGPYVPQGEAAPCPACGSMCYPEHSAQC